LFLSGFGIGGIVVLFLGSGSGTGTPLVLRRSAVVGKSEGDVGWRTVLGRTERLEPGCCDRLVDEAADRRLGVVVVPIETKLAKAFEVFSLANDASDRRLLLREILLELEWCAS
jgi:hypothetical protein